MLLGYNTNGFAHHDPLAAIEILAQIGYRSIALTIDHGTLAPQATSSRAQLVDIQAALQGHKLRCVIETGARFLLDPWTKHEPTLVSADPSARQRRIDFYRYSLDLAAELHADCVSLWSGIVRESAPADAVLDRLAEGLDAVCHHADQVGIDVGFEPEPGMAIDTMSRFARLLECFVSPRLKLTLDIGHLFCQGELPLADPIRRWGSRIVNVHLEDMRAGVHEHLMFGEGEMAFPPIISALQETGFAGSVHVELSRHAHDAVNAARKAFAFLSPLWPRT